MTTLTKPKPTLSAPSRPYQVEVEVEVDERAARRALRTQIARLELDLARALAAVDDGEPPSVPRSTTGAARLLTLGELERTRDALAGALRTARVRQEEQGCAHAQTRRLLEEARQDPRGHKYLRIALADLGEPGCGHYRVRPRLGLLGMLMGWWEVKLSGGCPLSAQPRVPRLGAAPSPVARADAPIPRRGRSGVRAVTGTVLWEQSWVRVIRA